ncbi:transposase domain-containing protein [Rhodoplanes sp. TEM]|uniref:Transposase domain-containing protein n=1 Tax=Rhodoplanes tepidamans TaxID=200616 RepID=A0ABT5JEB3_RHOTP|nr:MULTISPECIES: transposase domain-containing protein [Rhodoplanes]MDC7788008.1 transposase domain-containing protein [Rhodoplanes tepidamans]MDC7984848.1 transposase domain-containing protein [Rhodoplanes sp. TEM]MDQ0358437.1 transcriptional regulator with XRE-family HTH domain [Rhodoplanes tepidamans]
MREWFTLAELLDVGSLALPTDMGALSRLVEREGWRADTRRCRRREGKGGGWEYHISKFPADVQAKLVAREMSDDVDPAQARSARLSALWDRFATLSDRAKQEARDKLAAVDRIDLLSRGMARQVAVALVARETGVSASTLWGWLRAAAEVPASDRLAALAPRHAGRTATADCHPQAWAYLVADYLRPEQPAFSGSHGRMMQAAEAQGWAPIPSAKTLQRRIEKEFPRGLRTLLRKGSEAAARTYPAQTRDRSVFRAMEAVNADGHTFDVFVRWPDGTEARPVLIAVQDLYSGKIVGHRLDRSESWHAVRLAFRDAVESFGLPERAWLDNGRAFASKWMTGRQETRYRFKIRADEPEGILTGLGIQVHWATPYHGQAKPIERAFRDLTETISKHPACAGAYTGNKPTAKPDNYGSAAVPLAEFQALVAAEIARHNARPGRRTATAKGRSFDETFRESYEHPHTLVRKASPVQLHELMLAAEAVTARQPDGSLYLAESRYWSAALVDHIGKKLVVRFDPDNLLEPVAAYTLDGRFIAQADCIESAGFDDIAAAREHARKRKAYLRALREARDLSITLTAEDLARLAPRAAPAAPPPSPKVVRLVVGGRRAAAAQAIAAPAETEAEPDLGTGVGALLRECEARGVVPFARREKDEGGAPA